MRKKFQENVLKKIKYKACPSIITLPGHEILMSQYDFPHMMNAF